MTATEALRKQIKKYINKADEQSLLRVNAILEIDQNVNQWWADKEFVGELDNRYNELESGVDKGVSINELKNTIARIKLENSLLQ